MRKIIGVVLLLCAVALQSGCGYALAGRGNALPATIKSIGVPLFSNRSTTPEIDHALTQAVIKEFQSRGKYQIQSEGNGVDAVFVGIVTSVTSTPVQFVTGQNQVSRIAISVLANIEFREVSTGEVIWTNPSFRVRDEYDVTTGVSANDPNALFRQDANAMDRLSKSFARSVVTSIFEAF